MARAAIGVHLSLGPWPPSGKLLRRGPPTAPIAHALRRWRTGCGRKIRPKSVTHPPSEVHRLGMHFFCAPRTSLLWYSEEADHYPRGSTIRATDEPNPNTPGIMNS